MRDVTGQVSGPDLAVPVWHALNLPIAQSTRSISVDCAIDMLTSGTQRRRQPGVSQMTASGGRTTDADAGRPCHGLGTAVTDPRLPVPLPP
jgi:hypothetical protein